MVLTDIHRVPLSVAPAAPRKSLTELLAPIDRKAAHSASLVRGTVGRFDHAGETYEVPSYIYFGPTTGDAPVRVGIFAGIHGDEGEGSRALVKFLELLEENPSLARGYCLFAYPLCNPTGFEDNTPYSRNGRDLNREFWQSSPEPEVQLLERELVSKKLDGIVSLHTDEKSSGFYGSVGGATLTRHLLRPALAAASELLPLEEAERINGFQAVEGAHAFELAGRLSAPPKARPRPFEVALTTPGQAPSYVQECALVLALQSILLEYRRFLAFAANL